MGDKIKKQLGVLALFTACSSAASDEPTIPSSYELEREHLDYGITRLENGEVVCYRSGHGLQCHWKEQK